jgi:hypothetical protein
VGVFRKSVQNIQVLLKSDKNIGYFTWLPIYIPSYLTQFLLGSKIFQSKFVERPKTHICVQKRFFLENLTLY